MDDLFEKVEDNITDNFDKDKIDDAIKDALAKLIEGIGSAEKENVQEGTSRYTQENRQEQLKKDIAWLKKFNSNNNDDSNQIGLARNRARRKQILDVEI